jgi:hypothetical protein
MIQLRRVRLVLPFGERGDTLVEVTIALAILALVLTSSFALANRAFLVGQNAKERTQLVADAQQQIEALASFRDSYSWSQFVAGDTSLGFSGIRVRAGSGDCDPGRSGTQLCFHMVRQVIAGGSRWVPVVGPVPSSQIGGQGFARILVDNDVAPGAVMPSYTFAVQYGVPALGGGVPLASTVRLHLTNLDALR